MDIVTNSNRYFLPCICFTISAPKHNMCNLLQEQIPLDFLWLLHEVGNLQVVGATMAFCGSQE